MNNRPTHQVPCPQCRYAAPTGVQIVPARCGRPKRSSPMWRLARVLLAVVVGVVVTAPAASAAPDIQSRPAPDRALATLLGELWETVLETPVPENPLAAGEPWCVEIG